MGSSYTTKQNWPRFVLVATVVTMVMGLAVPRASAAVVTPAAFEQCLLDRINASRAQVGAQPLAMAVDRVEPVRNWSYSMSVNGFRHMTSAERDPILPPGTSTWGENIAWTSNSQLSDCSQIHNMLMNSPGHRAHILATKFKFVALGAYVDGSGWWVTELFFNAAGYPPTSPCPEGAVCDTLALQDTGGRFHLWSEIDYQHQVSAFYYGNPGDVAFAGDWDCDGIETLGLYRRSDGYVYLRNANTEGVAHIAYYFGNPGDYPIAGDFNGDGCDTVSIYRPSQAGFYIINDLGAANQGLGAADHSFTFGAVGDKPFVGDFNGDGIETVGLHREATGRVYLRNTHTTGPADREFTFGNPGDILLAGDWDGDGEDTVGVYRPSDRAFYARNTNSAGPADAILYAGAYAGVVVLRP